MKITESEIEQIAITELQQLGWAYVPDAAISPDGEQPERTYDDVILKNRLQNAIARINPNIPQKSQEEALRKVLRTESPNLNQNNYRFQIFLTEGVDVEYRKDLPAGQAGGRIVGDKVWLVDYENPSNNEYLLLISLPSLNGLKMGS